MPCPDGIPEHAHVTSLAKVHADARHRFVIGVPILLERGDQSCLGGQPGFDGPLECGLMRNHIPIGHSQSMPLNVTTGKAAQRRA